MPELALYRKYRPFNFKNLVGQDNVKNAIVNAIKNGKQAHAYLFSGPRGTGKTTTARLLAKAFNCLNLQDGYEPCNECEICNAINDGSLIDLIEIDAASNRGIDEIRDLKEKINFSPSRARSKVYIIDEVHMLTKEAFNALLKTLEEPPSYVYFILATTEIHKVPETIISRCQRFDFKRIDERALMARLSYIAQIEGVEAEDKAVEAIARHVEGSLRDAIQLLEQFTVDNKLGFEHVKNILGISDFETLDKLLEGIMSSDADLCLNTIRDVHSQGYDLNQFCHEFINLVRDKLLNSVTANEQDLISKYLSIINSFQIAKERLKTYTIPQLPLEIAVIESVGLASFPVVSTSTPSPASTLKPLKDTKTEAKTVSAIKEVFGDKPNDSSKVSNSEKLVGNEDAKADTAVEDMNVASGADESSLSNFDLSSVRVSWPRIIERIEIPACKRSLIDGEIARIEGAEVTIEFKSNFHRNKVMEHDNRIEIERVFKEVFGKELKILGKVKEIQISSAVSKNKNPSSVLDDAMDVFGGELIDE